MDEILRFIGDAQKIIIETAKIQHSTFSEKEGKKESLIEVNYTQDGYLLSKKDKKSIENYIYIEKNLMSVHVSDLNNILLYKIEYDYEDGFLTKKSKTNNQGRVEEVESYINNDIGQIIEKISKTMRYQYEYLEDLLVEERWISDISLNQIIRFKYENRLLIEKQYFSGNEIPGRKIAYSRNKYGFITNEIVYSTSGEIISHIMYEYKTIFKDNWLKRVKNSLHNRKKEPIEVQYRDFKFFERISTKKDVESLEELIERPIEESIEEEDARKELVFDNGRYLGEIEQGQMHGQGDFIFNTGTRYIGSFFQNMMAGRGKLTYISGKVYEGTFVNNILEGPGACKWENGDFYAGEFKNGQMHGKGCYIWENGNRFEGIFENNSRTEQGILYKATELESTAPPEWVNELFK